MHAYCMCLSTSAIYRIRLPVTPPVHSCKCQDGIAANGLGPVEDCLSGVRDWASRGGADSLSDP